MLDRGRIHQDHVREIRDVSTCIAQHVVATRRSIWRDVTLPWQRPRYQRSWFMAWRHVPFTKKTYPLQTCYEHNMLLLLNAVCLNVLVFTNVFCELRECETLRCVYVSWERRSIQTGEEQEEFLSMVQRRPTTSTCWIASRLRVPQSRVWRTFHYDGLYPFHHQPVQCLHPGDDAYQLQFCHWLSHNRELNSYILFTD